MYIHRLLKFLQKWAWIWHSNIKKIFQLLVWENLRVSRSPFNIIKRVLYNLLCCYESIINNVYYFLYCFIINLNWFLYVSGRFIYCNNISKKNFCFTISCVSQFGFTKWYIRSTIASNKRYKRYVYKFQFTIFLAAIFFKRKY